MEAESQNAGNREHGTAEPERYAVYEDANGNSYVFGDLGGGETIYWDGGYLCADPSLRVWDYCIDITAEELVRFCRKTGKYLPPEESGKQNIPASD